MKYKSEEINEQYHIFASSFAYVKDERGMSAKDINDKDGTKLAKKLLQISPLKLDSVISLLKVFDCDINFLFTNEISGDDKFTQKLKFIDNIKKAREQEDISIEMLSKITGASQEELTKFENGGNPDFRIILAILKELNIDINKLHQELMYPTKVVSDTDVKRICSELAHALKWERNNKKMKVRDMCRKGNISATTVYKLEKDPASVGIKKTITYMSILGMDIMVYLHKMSSSYDPDIRVVEFYNALADYRNGQEIKIKDIAEKLKIPVEKIHRCENYRADISTFTALKWLRLLNLKLEFLP